MIHFSPVEQRSEEWHKLRLGKVTGSNCHILLEKGLREALDANNGTFRGNYHTDRGIRLEPEAIAIYEMNFDKVGLWGWVWNDDYPNAGCSPDGISNEYLIEVKCFAEKNHYLNMSQVQFKVMAQIQFNMLITGLDKARLVLYNPDLREKEFEVIDIERNENIVRNIIDKLKGN